MPQVADTVGVTGSVLLVAGGVAYTLGGIVYATERPDPFRQCSATTRSSTCS